MLMQVKTTTMLKNETNDNEWLGGWQLLILLNVG